MDLFIGLFEEDDLEVDNFINEGGRFSKAQQHELYAPYELQPFLCHSFLARRHGTRASFLRSPTPAQGGPTMEPILCNLAPYLL